MKEEMTPLERFAAVLRREEPDRVPLMLAGVTIGARISGMTIGEYCTSGENIAKGQLALCDKFGAESVAPVPDVWYLVEGPWGGKVRFLIAR